MKLRRPQQNSTLRNSRSERAPDHLATNFIDCTTNYSIFCLYSKNLFSSFITTAAENRANCFRDLGYYRHLPCIHSATSRLISHHPLADIVGLRWRQVNAIKTLSTNLQLISQFCFALEYQTVDVVLNQFVQTEITGKLSTTFTRASATDGN